MQPRSIYLAKSNRSNPDILIKFRGKLKDQYPDLPIYEYAGGPYGAYEHEKVLDADVYVFIPPQQHIDNSMKGTTVSIGRGLYEQMAARNFKKCYIVRDSLGVSELISIPVLVEGDKSTWADNYAKVRIDGIHYYSIPDEQPAVTFKTKVTKSEVSTEVIIKEHIPKGYNPKMLLLVVTKNRTK